MEGMKLKLALFSCLLSILSFKLTEGFKQEIFLHESENQDGIYHYFNVPIPDSTLYALQRVKVACARGVWSTFRDENFATPYVSVGNPAGNNSLVCKNVESHIGSFRYWGANQTDLDSISLYTEESYSGREFKIDSRASAGITELIKSITATGTSSWMLFEGINFDGNSYCYEVPSPGNFFNWNNLVSLELTTVGSVLKGCDGFTIREFQEKQRSDKNV